jgi:hypothetical protein
MSLFELLPAFCALPKAEQQQPLLINGVSNTPPLQPALDTAALRVPFPPGLIAEVWSPLVKPTDGASRAATAGARAKLVKGAP